MVYQLLGLGNISVGAPCFNSLIFPVSVLALVALAFMPTLKWMKGTRSCAYQDALISTAVSTVSCIGFVLAVDVLHVEVLLMIALATWVAAAHSVMLSRSERKSQLMPMTLAHIGFALAVSGAVFNSHYSYEYNLHVEPGSSLHRAGVTIDYYGIEWLLGPNYTSEQGQVTLRLQDGSALNFKPEKRHYPVRVMNMTEPAIRSLWHGDYYVTLGDKVETHAYATKVRYRAGIWWIWSDGILAVFGALMIGVKRRREAIHEIEKFA